MPQRVTGIPLEWVVRDPRKGQRSLIYIHMSDIEAHSSTVPQTNLQNGVEVNINL